MPDDPSPVPFASRLDPLRDEPWWKKDLVAAPRGGAAASLPAFSADDVREILKYKLAQLNTAYARAEVAPPYDVLALMIDWYER